jgi:general secretion pathway protein D
VCGWLRGAGGAAVALIVPGALAQTVTLNLQDADLSALIETVSEATGRNFIVDPRVKAKVTVVSSKPIDDDELYPVLLSVLKVHGFAAVPAGPVTKIVPQALAKAEAGIDGSRPRRGEEVETRVIRLEHVPADQLVPVLRPLLPPGSHLAAYPAGNVLIVSDHAANVARIRALVARIDVAGDQEIEVVALRHASAVELVRVLNLLHGGAAKGAVPGGGRVVADERTNSVLIGGDRPTRLRLRAVVSHLDTPLEAGGTTQVLYLRYADAETLVPILESVIRGEGVAGGEGAAAAGGRLQSISIQADKTLNALVITAPPAVTESLRGVIRQLDVRRAQVLVEAVIAEVSADMAVELGVQWRSTTEPQNSGVFGGTNFTNTGASNINQLSVNPLGAGAGLNLGFIDGLASFAGQQFLNLAVLVRALAADANSNILSTPSVVTLDNEEAEFVVAQNVPFVTGQFTDTGTVASSVNPFQTIEREDVGLTLRVTPQINAGDAMTLAIEQEVSNLVPTASPQSAQSQGAVDLITQRRAIRTRVMVADGGILVLGGLINEDVIETHDKVPVLGDIPGLGWLFRYDRTTKVKRNLMVFLRPVILNERNAETISSAKYGYLRAIQQERRDAGVALMPAEEMPLAPPLEQLRTHGVTPRLPGAAASEAPPDSGAEEQLAPGILPSEMN